MSVKALQDYTFVSRYARYLPEKKRRETWQEAVTRVKEMHLRRYPQIADDIEWAFELVRQKRVLGSQRALQFGGEAVEKKHLRLYNCLATHCDRLRVFQEIFYALLCGSGVGVSVQKHHIDMLPEFLPENAYKNEVKEFIIPDTIEGWADSLGVLMSSFFGGGDFPEYAGYDVEFNYNYIRPQGAPLSSSSGKAPGPEPLKRALEKIRECLKWAVAIYFENYLRPNKLKPIEAYDIIMHSADAVLSGGVRRSAVSIIFSKDDDDMMRAKTGDWFKDNPQRGRSNNSVMLVREQTSKKEFNEIFANIKQFGEPGFVFADSTEVCFNPCFEIAMYPVDIETGKSGFQACNLTEINGKKCKTEEDFLEAARAAAIIGTCQAGYTDFSYLGETTEKIVRKEALLGVSITGMMDNIEILLNPSVQKKAAKVVVETNKEFAEKIGINQAARTTALKPAGSTSCILGSSSGIHPHHATRYIRRVQSNSTEAPLQHFKKVNDMAVENSVWSANDTDEVISFCIEVPPGVRTKNTTSALEMLEFVKLTQNNWIKHGKNEDLCVKPYLSHNVSNTIVVKEDEWEDVTNYLYKNRTYFACVSLLPVTGDKDYPQAPFTTIYTPRELVTMYGDASVMASGLIVDGLNAFHGNLWNACEAVLGFGNHLQEPSFDPDDFLNGGHSRLLDYQAAIENYISRIDWIRRAQQFAERYFDNDVRKMTYCLKDVNNWKYWCDLNREYKDVDYTTMIEEEDNTKLVEEVACAGGACEII